MSKLSLAAGAVLCCVLSSCDAAEESSGPPTTGWVAVRTVTAGEAIPGQMNVALASKNRLLGSSDMVVFDSVGPGSHTVRVTDAGPGFCQVIGAAEQAVTVMIGDTSHVTFELQCPIVGAERLIVFIGGPVYSMTEYVTRQKVLTSIGQNYYATVSPDGTRIAFTSTRDGNEEIYVMNSDGSNPVNLTNSPLTRDWWPRWSPDGTRLVFFSWITADGPRSGEIYVMQASGAGTRQQLTTNGDLDADPEFSPDGTRIVFMRESGGAQSILLMNADGSGEVLLSAGGLLNGQPSWSPDGKRIAFATSRFGPADAYDIVVMNADGTGLIQLTDDPEIDVHPVWSPDGRRIAFNHRAARGDVDVWIMNIDGTGLRPLLLGAGNQQVSDWAVLR